MKHYKLAIILASTLSLSACDKKEQNADNDVASDAVVTETVLDDVDSSEGTISDAMINVEGLDQSSDTPEEIKDDKEKDSE